MQSLYSMAITLATMAVISALLEFLMPSGPLKKTVVLAIGMVFVLIIATPIIKLMQGEVSIDAIQWNQQPLQETTTHEELLRELYDQQWNQHLDEER